MARDGTQRCDWKHNLALYMTEALKQVDDGLCSHISVALIPRIPDMVNVVGDILIDSTSTPTMKMRAIELLFSAWNRCLRADLRLGMADVSRQKSIAKQSVAQAAKTRARADEKKLAVVSARERQRFARKLAKHAVSIPVPAPKPAAPDVDELLRRLKAGG